MKTTMLTIASLLGGATLVTSAAAQGQEAGASLSVGATTDGVQADATGPSTAAPAAGDADDARGYMDRYPPEPGLFEVGMFAGIIFPSERHALYDSSSARHVPFDTAAPELGLRLAYFPLTFLGAELEGAVMPSGTEDDGSAGLWAVRGHAILQLPGSSVTPFALIGAGALGAGGDTIGTDWDGAVHFGAGVKVPLDEFLSVRLDLRDSMSQKYQAAEPSQTHHPELLIGLTYTLDRYRPKPPPPPDRDGDGIPDTEDQCPNEAGPAPTGCPVRDSDSDGIPDGEDQCPNEAGPAPTGCPPPPPDCDQDGIPDDQDKCPGQPGIAPDGCPDPDPDGDGIKGSDDRCPNEPETFNGFEDEDGCPDEVPEAVKQFSGVIEGIEFTFGKAAIRRVSFPVLDGAVEVLKQYPKLRIMVTGHTDDSGDRARNVTLSQDRAESVKRYLVDKGIGEGRIETRGAGPNEPIADNATEAGRQKNRRTEFKLLQ